MSQEVHFKSSTTKEGKLMVLVSRYGRHIYLNEAEARKLRDDLTETLRKAGRKNSNERS